MFRLRAPDDEQLDALLAQREHAPVTYDEAGSTRTNDLPHGFHHDHYFVGLGSGTFDRAIEGLRAWQAHLGAGVGVYPPTAPLQVNTNVIVSARAGPLHALAPCRIVYAVDEPDRFGFAYGTLAGHPECGEEAFIVDRDNRDAVTFSIVAFSRPADILARVGSPVARRIQRHTTEAYLEALRRHCATTTS